MSFASIWDIELSEQKVYQNFFCCKNAVDWAFPKKHKIQLLLWYKTPKQSWRSVTMHLGKERRKQRYSIWQRNFYPPNVDFELCECGVSLVNEMLLKGKEAWSGLILQKMQGIVRGWYLWKCTAAMRALDFPHKAFACLDLLFAVFESREIFW